MIIETQAREVTSTAEIIANRKAVREYFRTLPEWRPPEPPPLPIIDEPSQPVAFRIPLKLSTRILNAVCDYYEVTRDEMQGQSRKPHHVRPRWIAMFLLQSHAGMSYPSIGRLLNRDHTTVLHGVESVVRDSALNPAIAAEVAEILGQL